MAPCAFDTHKGSPAGMLRRKTLTGDEPWSLSGVVSTGDLWGKRQEQFIQQPLCEKVSQQLRATLDQDDVALAYSAHRLYDRLGTE